MMGSVVLEQSSAPSIWLLLYRKYLYPLSQMVPGCIDKGSSWIPLACCLPIKTLLLHTAEFTFPMNPSWLVNFVAKSMWQSGTPLWVPVLHNVPGTREDLDEPLLRGCEWQKVESGPSLNKNREASFLLWRTLETMFGSGWSLSSGVPISDLWLPVTTLWAICFITLWLCVLPGKWALVSICFIGVVGGLHPFTHVPCTCPPHPWKRCCHYLCSCNPHNLWYSHWRRNSIPLIWRRSLEPLRCEYSPSDFNPEDAQSSL